MQWVPVLALPPLHQVLAQHTRAVAPLQASAASWLADTGLPVDKDGFLLVNDCLQSDGGPPNVFAAGDVASNRHNPRPKAGVFAVRAVSCTGVAARILVGNNAGMGCGPHLCVDCKSVQVASCCTAALVCVRHPMHCCMPLCRVHPWQKTCSAC
mgnify:CR=1 FL=1